MNPVIIGDVTLYEGDCLAIMQGLPDNSVDSIVTDPPYGLRFMGKKWDHGVPAVEVWQEAMRVLKPGGHLLAFGGSRTYHRMAVAIEDAGFEIRDQIMWIYGSGFPKSRNLDGEWEGWGTALKPAHEPICMARKTLSGTVEENVLAHGTGAINIDACRVEGSDKPVPFGNPTQAEGWRLNKRETNWQPSEIGRWPANVIHDGSEEVMAAFPDAPGQLADASANSEALKTQNVYGDMRRGRGGEASANSDNAGAVGFKMKPGARRFDTGSAARFFYCPKASRADRNAGCSDLPDQAGGMNSNTSGQHITRRDGWKPEPVKNNHPTVKPTDLMAYLCRLVTPPGGVVLDPFMGSGSTGKACMREGFGFIGIDMTPEYFQIARARIQHECDEVAQQQAEASIPVPQLDLFAGEPA